MHARRCSLGLEASVNVGCLVAHHREHVVGQDLTKTLIVRVEFSSRIIDSGGDAIIKLVHGMLFEEVDEDAALTSELRVGDEGADLGSEVGNRAREEGVV